MLEATISSPVVAVVMMVTAMSLPEERVGPLSLGPDANHKVLDLAGVGATDNLEQASVSPVKAPGIDAELRLERETKLGISVQA